MAKKDSKSKAAEKKARTLAKQSKKADKQEKKDKRKGKDQDDSDSDDQDLDTILEEYAKQVSYVNKQSCSFGQAGCTLSSSTIRFATDFMVLLAISSFRLGAGTVNSI